MVIAPSDDPGRSRAARPKVENYRKGQDVARSFPPDARCEILQPARSRLDTGSRRNLGLRRGPQPRSGAIPVLEALAPPAVHDFTRVVAKSWMAYSAAST